jgi:hypothetical protein
MPYKYLLPVAGLSLLAFSARPSADASAMVPMLAPVVVAAPATPVAAAAKGEDEMIATALSALGARVGRLSHQDALRKAFDAYYSYKAAHPGEVQNPYFYFVDYGLDNRTPRGYVFDMEQLKLVDGPFIVAHGRGSSAAKNAVPMRFTNRPGSASTSLGLYVAQETYGFSGKSGGAYYTSIGLRMKGVSGRFNSTARERGVVVHGAPYVTAAGAGRSEGCPAMEQSRARRLIPKIANGGLVYLFSPNDDNWLANDPWSGDLSS